MGRVMTGDYDDEQKKRLARYGRDTKTHKRMADEGVMWVVFGRLFATVLYTIVTNCSSIYPVLYPEVHFCLFQERIGE